MILLFLILLLPGCYTVQLRPKVAKDFSALDKIFTSNNPFVVVHGTYNEVLAIVNNKSAIIKFSVEDSVAIVRKDGLINKTLLYYRASQDRIPKIYSTDIDVVPSGIISFVCKDQDIVYIFNHLRTLYDIKVICVYKAAWAYGLILVEFTLVGDSKFADLNAVVDFLSLCPYVHNYFLKTIGTF